MQTLATGIWRTKGFTLLEVMVVMVLIGIITGFAVLSLPRTRPDQALEEEAQRLQLWLAAQREAVLLRGQLRGVRFTERGYELVVRQQELWKPAYETGLRTNHSLPDTMTLRLSIEGRVQRFSEAQDPPPQVLLLPDGEQTEFQLSLEQFNVGRRTLSGDLLGNLQLSQ